MMSRGYYSPVGSEQGTTPEMAAAFSVAADAEGAETPGVCPYAPQTPFTPNPSPLLSDSRTTRSIRAIDRSMAAVGASGVSGGGGGAAAARLRLMCSHGGRFVPCGPDGGLRYVGGETRVLVVPREVPFRELAARLGEMAGAAGVAAVRYRLVDEGLDDVLVSVTCDDELAHMRDEYDRLRATRPSASFRVFVSTAAAQRRAASGLPPLASTMRRVQSEQAFPARAHLRTHEGGLAPMRRVHSALELAGGSRLQPCVHHRCHQCCFCCCCHRRRDVCAPVPQPAPMYPLPSMSKNANGLRPGRQDQPAHAVSTAKAAGRVTFTEVAREKARCRDAEVAMQKGRAFWEFE